MSDLYVSPSGSDDGPGTIDRPLASLAVALERVRSDRSERGRTTTIDLRAGRHVLREPIVLDAEDSGVVVRCRDAEPAVISGGREVDGWQRLDDGIWRAEVGDLDPRRLVVDGRPAERATRTGGIPGTVIRTETGYVTDAEIPQSWKGSEFVYTGVYPWSEARIGVADVVRDPAGTVITMEQPAFDWALQLYRSASEWAGRTDIGLPAGVENGLAFLARPGTFVLDKSTPGAHVLFYKPRPGEDPATTTTIAPALEQLLIARGAREISLRGLTFADTTWPRPGRPEGFLHYHGCGYYDGGELENLVMEDWKFEITVPGRGTRLIPSAVVFEDCSGVEVTDCRFAHLGSNALEFLGSKEILVRRSVLEELSGAGLLIGSGSRDCRFEDSTIRRTGREFRGSPAISVIAAHNVSIAHNEIREVPHAGVVVNGGEPAQGLSSGIRVEHNLIQGSMQVLADGGGIYLSGRQGSSYDTGAIVRRNVVLDTVTPYNFALYADYGARWITFQENVVGRADKPAILEVWPALDNVTFAANIWDAEPDGSENPPTGVTLADNRVVAADALPADPAAAAIMTAAGPRP